MSAGIFCGHSRHIAVCDFSLIHLGFYLCTEGLVKMLFKI